MAISQKYGRTYHYPFSPGTTSDDRIAQDYWENLQHIPLLIHTEKLDGENNCLSKHGVFALSCSASHFGLDAADAPVLAEDKK